MVLAYAIIASSVSCMYDPLASGALFPCLFSLSNHVVKLTLSFSIFCLMQEFTCRSQALQPLIFVEYDNYINIKSKMIGCCSMSVSLKVTPV